MENYAEAFTIQRASCFGLVDDGQGKPTGCPKAVIASGWVLVDSRWHELGAGGKHSADARFRGRPATP